MLYFFTEPFSASTVIVNLFSPSVTLNVPVPDKSAFESDLVAFIFISVVLLSAVTLYSVVSLLNAGSSFKPSILKLLRLLSFE